MKRTAAQDRTPRGVAEGAASHLTTRRIERPTRLVGHFYTLQKVEAACGQHVAKLGSLDKYLEKERNRARVKSFCWNHRVCCCRFGAALSSPYLAGHLHGLLCEPMRLVGAVPVCKDVTEVFRVRRVPVLGGALHRSNGNDLAASIALRVHDRGVEEHLKREVEFSTAARAVAPKYPYARQEAHL